ncbi:MAG: glycosyltransferase [Lachnospiraceae bacterium]|nr:glycosyltransferase [Lachnospiraceae bacterium]
MKFSVITVTFNSGDKLNKTLENILTQTFDDYEIIVKDGLSKDGSLEGIPKDERIKVCSERDNGSYDAMNRAVSLASGDFVIFMNCGDYFYETDVLSNVAAVIDEEPGHRIYYGDAFFRKAGEILPVPAKITPDVCYRFVPCHQACFFDRHLWDNGGFDLNYKIRGDYEFFLRAYFAEHVDPLFTELVIADYEGGGFSESKENRARDKAEHEEITHKYMSKKTIRKNKLFLALTLAPLRKYIAEESPLAGVYSKIKTIVYR